MPRSARSTLAALARPHLAGSDDDETTRLVRALRRARRRGHLTPAELEKVCRWKSPRAIGQIRRNARSAVRSRTALALRTPDEREKVVVLTGLKGVGIPMASSLLMLLDPARYGVLDIRVWQLLHQHGHVSGNPGGRSFTVDHWIEFLAVVRGLAAALRVSVRRAELALFEAHRHRRPGRLYAPARPRV
jgi:hypothetical protein